MVCSGVNNNRENHIEKQSAEDDRSDVQIKKSPRPSAFVFSLLLRKLTFFFCQNLTPYFYQIILHRYFSIIGTNPQEPKQA